ATPGGAPPPAPAPFWYFTLTVRSPSVVLSTWTWTPSGCGRTCGVSTSMVRPSHTTSATSGSWRFETVLDGPTTRIVHDRVGMIVAVAVVVLPASMVTTVWQGSLGGPKFGQNALQPRR